MSDTVLKADSALPDDIGKGRARLSLEVMEELGVNEGDIVEVIGEYSTYAVALSGEFEPGSKTDCEKRFLISLSTCDF